MWLELSAIQIERIRLALKEQGRLTEEDNPQEANYLFSIIDDIDKQVEEGINGYKEEN